MPRTARKNLETCFFHIIVQGINKEYIFQKDEYKKKYLFLIQKYSALDNVKLISYCIMSNHAHFLIYTEDINSMSKMMLKINTIYAKYYNDIENRVGYLFRDRYVSQSIINEHHLFRCLAYVHNNPVKAGIISKMEQYKYSSYNDYQNKCGIVTDEILRLVFGSPYKYMDMFMQIHESLDIDCVLDIEEDNYIYADIIKKYNDLVSIDKLNYKDGLLKSLVIDLNTKAGLSIRETAKRLNKNKDMLIRMLKK